MAQIVHVKPTFAALDAKELLRAGKTADAVAVLEAHLEANPEDHAAWHQLALAQTQQHGYFKALKAIRRAMTLVPQNMVYQRFTGFALSNLGRFDDAIKILAPIVEAHSEDYFALHALQIAYLKSGAIHRAIALGRTILELEDRAAVMRPLPAGSAGASSQEEASQRVIAYALWGMNPIYNYGAMVNARLAEFIYPGWQCRFYLGADVPESVKRVLTGAGAELIDAAEKFPDVSPTMWRFLVADDPSVAVFLCRDCDARISPKEAAAVDVWLRSATQCHVMRDHVLHRNLMLAGMWGARTDPPLRMRARMKRFLGKGLVDARYGIDQRFLGAEIWPVIRGSCLIHDSYYTLFDAQQFPVMGKGDDHHHVGMSILGEEILGREARLLGLPWPLETA
jgi:tetratricopeptide (TPR) repeat protein